MDGQFNYNLEEIAATIPKFEGQIEELRQAKSRIAPELEVLKEEWTSTAAKPTIVSIENFLNEDFESFLSLFNASKERLEVAKQNFQSIDEIG